MDIKGKTVVITGATAGLGKLTAIQMARRGARVVMGKKCLKIFKFSNHKFQIQTDSD